MLEEVMVVLHSFCVYRGDSERVSSVDIEANQNARFDKSSSLSLLTLPGINMRFISDSI